MLSGGFVSPAEDAMGFLGDYPFRPLHPYRRGKDGNLIWPIEEYLARTKHGRRVRERIARLNADGKEEGAGPRGWHPHHKSAWGSGWLSDLMGRAAYESKFGPGSYGRLPKEAFLRTGGKRKAISRLWIVERGTR